MIYHILILLLLAACHVAAVWQWKCFTSREVALNAADIKANGSADDLRAGYHQRRSWARFWPWLGLVTVGSLILLLVSYWAFLANWLSLGILVAGYFARYFTPALNVARGLPEFWASSDSASWPDAGSWKTTRANHPNSALAALGYDEQSYANGIMRRTLSRTWLAACILYTVGLVAVASLLLHST